MATERRQVRQQEHQLFKQDDGLTRTERDFEVLIKDVEKREKVCKKMKSYLDNLESETDVLKENLQMLERENEELKPAIKELDKRSCASVDARKMYGDLTPGDDTHDNVIRMYGDYFKKKFHSLTKELELSTEEKSKIREMTSDIVQECFQLNRDAILKEMMEELETALLTPPPADRALDDKTADLHKAFHIFVKGLLEVEQVKLQKGASCATDIKKQLQDKLVSQWDWNEVSAAIAIDLATDVITKLDPEDYYSFIEKGRKRDKIYYLNSSVEEKFCFACKKGFQIDKGNVPIYHLGYYWHFTHYSCGHCCKAIIDIEHFQYSEKLDRAYCSNCFCNNCAKPVDGQGFEDEKGFLCCTHCATCHNCGIVGNIKPTLMCTNCKTVIHTNVD